MHFFSMTCKVDSVRAFYQMQNERENAVDWFRKHSIRKLYLESYRHRVRIPREMLLFLRDYFLSEGFEVSGCLTTTMLSSRISGWDVTTCFTDEQAKKSLQELSVDCAAVFDEIILDDFFFSCCTCEECVRQKGEMSWGDARSSLML